MYCICPRCCFDIEIKIVSCKNCRKITFSNDLTCNISRKLLRPTQFLKQIMEIRNSSFYRNKPDPSTLLNVAGCWKRSKTKACKNKLSQILANNIDNGVRGVGGRRYCLKKLMKNNSGFGKTRHFLFA